MKITKTVQFHWDKEKRVGTASLYLNENIISKYTPPRDLHDVELYIKAYVGSYPTRKTFEDSQKQIDEYNGILGMYGLSQESPFHSSHLLYLLINFRDDRDQKLVEENITRKLYSRVYLLKQLMNVTNFDRYTVTIKGDGDFKYVFSSDKPMKDLILAKLIEETRLQVEDSSPEIIKMLESGATEEELEEEIKLQTSHQLQKSSLVALIKALLKYLNNETFCLKNNEQSDDTSVSNQQGDFIYDLLILFKAYKPTMNATNTAVRHHDTIRKIVRRSSLINEDN